MLHGWKLQKLHVVQYHEVKCFDTPLELAIITLKYIVKGKIFYKTNINLKNKLYV